MYTYVICTSTEREGGGEREREIDDRDDRERERERELLNTYAPNWAHVCLCNLVNAQTGMVAGPALSRFWSPPRRPLSVVI